MTRTLLLGVVLGILAAGCGDGSSSGGTSPTTDCADEAVCEGDYTGRIAGDPEGSGCSNQIVRFSVSEGTITLTEFQANCAMATCSRCLNVGTFVKPIDPDDCSFSMSHTGSFILRISGSLDPSNCTASGTYNYTAPASCPCRRSGTWTASRN